MGLTFDTLAEVALARDMLRRWYGLELGLSAADGSDYDRTSHETCESVRKHPSGGCAAALKEAASVLAGRKGAAAVVHRCHAGLSVVAAPVRSTSGLTAIVYSTGGRTNAEATSSIGTLLSLGADEATAAAARAPELSDADIAHVKDLVEAAAQAVERALPTVIPPTTFTHPFTEMVGDAPAIREVVKLLTKVVKSEATVLIHGESGTGKELIARAIHYHGPRAKKTFVVQNCSAFNDNLLESALFGHVRGAFTGAVKDQKGLFEVADGGTFFLDEIGDMSAALQVKLLRVLQEGTFTPVGGTKPIKVDVRIIAASHKDLQAMVAHKQFREDLFYRVNVLKITVPPLRDRVADIPRLAAYFVTKHWKFPGPAPRLSQSALARLVAYPWPGNIRELENEIERMLVLAADAQELTASMVSQRLGGQSVGTPRTLRDALAIAEAGAITESLGRHSGDRDAAAADLNVSRAYLEARVAALGL
ncbi:MAG TPA: sigma 54-interacting transcriptional regulator [Kofleriaceae bacterium]|nr:sigma 54-interacting transcriptional regulator [Kofleriaceae bacterium]